MVQEQGQETAGALQLGRTLSVQGVKWVAALAGGCLWRTLVSACFGIFVGGVIGLVYGMILSKLGVHEGLARLHIPSVLCGFYFVVFGILGFGLLGAMRGIRLAAARASGDLVDKVTRALAKGVHASLGKDEAAATLRLDDVESAVKALTAGLQPSPSGFFLVRWVKRAVHSAAEKASEGIVSACREVATADEDGTLKVDALDAAAEVAKRKAQAASNGAVSRAIMVPRLVVIAALGVLYLVPLLALLVE